MPWRHWIDLGRYAMAVLLATTVPPAIVYWFIVHPFIGFWRRVGVRGTFWFLTVFLIVAGTALYPFRDALLGRDLGLQIPLVIAAVPLFVISTVISRKRRRFLDFRTLAGAAELDPVTHGKGLFTEGIYGRIRHPRYVEFTLGLAAWVLFCNFAGLYLLTLLSIVGLYLIVIVEEKELRERFGEAYVDYSARVPRFVPHLR
jgi:protein-S-isoprenylcysteine O-methyltransferase Ste14